MQILQFMIFSTLPFFSLNSLVYYIVLVIIYYCKFYPNLYTCTDIWKHLQNWCFDKYCLNRGCSFDLHLFCQEIFSQFLGQLSILLWYMKQCHLIPGCNFISARVLFAWWDADVDAVIWHQVIKKYQGDAVQMMYWWQLLSRK